MKKQLELLIPTVDMIAKTFGNDCEVVLHDVEDLEHSVVYIANSHVTDRKIGQSFNHYVSKILLKDNYDEDQFSNYYFYSNNGKLIKSSTSLIRDENDEIIGAICINMDTTKITQQIDWLNTMIPNLNKEEMIPDKKYKDRHISDLLDDIIDNVVLNKDIATLSRREKINLVNSLDKQGVFLMKGAIDKVAERMGISKVTIYSYIDELRSN